MSWKMISLRPTLFRGALKNIEVRNIYTGKSLRKERKDHYEVLGIKKDATQTEIKNAYFELSKIYHPDRIAATDENLAKFREISAAYEVLGNEQSRKLYDRGLIKEGKMGIDVPEDTKDPIIKFYKQRQMRSKLASSDIDGKKLGEWTQQYYEETKRKSFKKTDLFRTKEKSIEYNEYVPSKFAFIIGFGLLLHFGIRFHSENDSFREFVLKKIYGDKAN